MSNFIHNTPTTGWRSDDVTISFEACKRTKKYIICTGFTLLILIDSIILFIKTDMIDQCDKIHQDYYNKS